MGDKQQLIIVMSKDCLLGAGVGVSCLSLLAYLIIAVIAVPVTVSCQFNSDIPADAVIELSMNEWIVGGMLAGIIMFAMLSGCAKNNSSGDCAMGFVGGLLILYVLFIFVWSCIGLTIYYGYYAQVCSNQDSYTTYMDLGLYFGLVLSSLLILVMMIAGVSYCRKTCCVGRKEAPLLDRSLHEPARRVEAVRAEGVRVEAVEAVDAARAEGEVHNEASDIQYAKIGPREEVVITDEQFQQNRNIYLNMFNRLSGRQSGQRFS